MALMRERERECKILIAKHGFGHGQRLREEVFSRLPLWVRERRESQRGMREKIRVSERDKREETSGKREERLRTTNGFKRRLETKWCSRTKLVTF